MSQQMSEKDERWSDAELKAAIEAYLWMLEQEKTGKPYKKNEVNKSLRHGILAKRSRGSIEYRMENISATLSGLCQPWIRGYKPHGNIGRVVNNKILGILDELGFVNSNDYDPAIEPEILDERVHRLIRQKLVGTPKGNSSPKRVSVTSYQYARDPIVKSWILQHAAGKCELCEQPAPFVMNDGVLYLEIHHVVPLFAGGPDKTNNAVALCPNCHKRCHLSRDHTRATKSLYGNINRLVRFKNK